MKILLKAPPSETKVFDIDVENPPDIIKWGLSLWFYHDTEFDEEDNEIIIYKPAVIHEVPV